MAFGKMTFMKKFCRILFVISFLFLDFSVVNCKDWHAITPLRSTMKDVQLLLGSDLKFDSFNAANATIHFHHKKAEGQNYGQFARCDVPVGTVYAITMNFRMKIPRSIFEDENLRFEKILTCTLNSFRYFNKAEGLKISANETFIESVIYLPTMQDIDHFKCPTDFN